MSLWSRKTVIKFALKSPEIAELPPDWSGLHEDEAPHRIYFTSPDGNITTWDHPTLGPLPHPWQLHLVSVENGDWEPRYRNTETSEIIATNPRFHPDVLQARKQSSTGSESSKMAAGLVKNYTGLMESAFRAPILGDKNIRAEYEIVHTIDSGQGDIGAMNGGVYVVKMKGHPQLYVEKRFRPDYDYTLARREVEILRRVRHGSLTLYCASFINDKQDPKDGSIFVEYCDRGSLEDIIKCYIKRRIKNKSDDLIPELFVWHAFLGLADGFAYLQGGRSYINDDPHTTWKPKSGWMPILHRDTKPDNVLLRSRSTLASERYFYCILTDFGLACDDDRKDPYQIEGAPIGTPHYWAPELCWDPYPDMSNPRHSRFPGGARHSAKSDIWALAACMMNLVHPLHVRYNDKSMWQYPGAHLTFDNMPADLDYGVWLKGKASRREMVVKTNYSKQLKDAIALAGRTSLTTRPDAINCVRRLKIFLEEGKINATGPQKESDRLPSWATRHHDHYTKIQS